MKLFLVKNFINVRLENVEESSKHENLQQALNSWKAELLDLSGRNQLLYLRDFQSQIELNALKFFNLEKFKNEVEKNLTDSELEVDITDFFEEPDIDQNEVRNQDNKEFDNNAAIESISESIQVLEPVGTNDETISRGGQIILQALKNIGGSGKLKDIYDQVRLIDNNIPESSIRRDLQKYSHGSKFYGDKFPELFVNTSPGKWEIVSEVGKNLINKDKNNNQTNESAIIQRLKDLKFESSRIETEIEKLKNEVKNIEDLTLEEVSEVVKGIIKTRLIDPVDIEEIQIKNIELSSESNQENLRINDLIKRLKEQDDRK